MANSITILDDQELEELKWAERFYADHSVIFTINEVSVWLQTYRNDGICTILEELYSDKGWRVKLFFYASKSWAEKKAYKEMEGEKYVTGTRFMYKYVQLDRDELDRVLGVPVDVIEHYILINKFPFKGEGNVSPEKIREYAPLMEKYSPILDEACSLFIRH